VAGKQPVGVEIFDRIAEKYDAISGFLSLGIIRRWQRELVKSLSTPGVTLDLACGTGDVAALVKDRAEFVVGLDYSLPMLKVAKEKFPDIAWVRGDALRLPFPDRTFDTVLISLALRHFEDVKGSLKEIRRVLKEGGQVRILEVSVPRSPVLRSSFLFFLRRVMLPLGKLRSRADVTKHLYESIVNFPHYESLIELARKEGFKGGSYRPLMAGMATIYHLTG
jgi:demethylmenaquinone methyltransferase/2-methoxy-6-polyprenyl-1,4-benzoquinol methylase